MAYCPPQGCRGLIPEPKGGSEAGPMHNRETEVKIRIADIKATRRRLRELGFRQMHRRALEDNTLFDTPDRGLRKVRSILRLRHYGPQWVLTFKGTPGPDSTYKS